MKNIINLFLLLALTLLIECQNQTSTSNLIINPVFPKKSKYKLGMIMYPGFTTMDLVGPAQVLGDHPDMFDIYIITESLQKKVANRFNFITFQADLTFEQAKQMDFDIIMCPGGLEGTLQSLLNPKLLNDYKYIANKTPVLFTVCTGALVLARTGALDGYYATTNKQAYPFFTPLLPKVDWIHKARWVHHKNRITSSGVTAGIDAAFYILSLAKGEQAANSHAIQIEYVRHIDPNDDPFAKSGSEIIGSPFRKLLDFLPPILPPLLPSK